MLVASGWLLCAQSASAHVLVTDRGVSAIFHLEPDDAPVPGATSTIVAIFQPASNLNLMKCNCQVTLLEGAKTLLDKPITDPLFSVTPENVTFQYVFPDYGAYTLVLAGESFRLAYSFEVQTGTASMQMSVQTHAIHIVLFGAALFYGGYIIIDDWRSKHKQPSA